MPDTWKRVPLFDENGQRIAIEETPIIMLRWRMIRATWDYSGTIITDPPGIDIVQDGLFGTLGTPRFKEQFWIDGEVIL